MFMETSDRMEGVDVLTSKNEQQMADASPLFVSQSDDGLSMGQIARLDLDAERSLSEFCSPEYLIHLSTEQRYSNEEIAQVSALLRNVDGGAWSAIPRLYIVLRRIGLLKLRDQFTSRQITDASFPFVSTNLPSGMQDWERAAFLRAQDCILTSTTLFGNCEFGEHIHFAQLEQIPFQKKGILGGGGDSQVERVESTISKRQYARKIVRRKVFGRFQEGLETFKNELRVLKSVQHQHIVEIVGSYTDPLYAALIMSPVADCDLSEFLRQAPRSQEKLSSLRTFFGCLATAMWYLHRIHIRHKDIKPSNILVHNGNVLLTDFGLSRDCNHTRSTTEGPTGLTPKYCAPEVAGYDPRSYSSDIWSLGCVYLEMITVLKGNPLNDLTKFIAKNGIGGRTAYHCNLDTVSRWIKQLHQTNSLEPDNVPLLWVEAMIGEEPTLRPTAELLAAGIKSHRSDSDRVGEFCGICCRTEDEYFSNPEEEGPTLTPDDSDVMSTTEGLTSVSTALTLVNSTEEAPQTVPRMSGYGWSQARYFVLRSSNELDIETSAAHSVWTCGKGVNGLLDNAYRKRSGPIMLIFSVVKSRKFCGVAEMTSVVDKHKTFEHWEEDTWTSLFTVDWKSWTEIQYDDVKHLKKNKEGEEGDAGFAITRGMNGSEICASSGAEMMRRFGVAMT